jgi:hypothetical protein
VDENQITAGVKGSFHIPKSMTAEQVRVLRDHVCRAKEELARVAKKFPGSVSGYQCISARHGSTFDLGDMLAGAMVLTDMLSTEWVKRSPKHQKKLQDKIKHNLPVTSAEARRKKGALVVYQSKHKESKTEKFSLLVPTKDDPQPIFEVIETDE